jgi:ABC-type transport system involved in multi-copper enzyme maturation permease subunit
MLKHIVLKELRDHLFGLRFVLTLVLILLVFIASSLLFTNHYNNKLSEFRDIQNKNLEAVGQNARNLTQVAFLQQPLQLKPSPLEFVAEGGIKNIPNTFQVTAFDVSEPQSVSEENNFMKRFRNVDWSFIIAFILSFFAVLMTYDAVCGEKSAGTLGIMMSNSIGRNTVIAGKYLSALFEIAIPLVFGILLSLLLCFVFGKVVFTSAEIGKIAVYLAASLFYLSIYILLGLLVTSLTKNSITSVILLLFVWVFFAVLLPHSGGKIASRFFPIPTREQVTEQITERQREIRQEARDRNSKVFSWTGSIWHVHLPDRAAAYNAMADARIRMNDEYMSQRLNQIRKAKSVLKISPTAVFFHLSEQICQTGIDRYENFYKQVFDYRKQLNRFIVDADRLDPKVPHLVYERDNGATISKRKVEANAIPKFEEKAKNFSEALKNVLPNIGILLGINILLFLGVFGAFNRYDVR